jgi:hypothetical protein
MDGLNGRVLTVLRDSRDWCTIGYLVSLLKWAEWPKETSRRAIESAVQELRLSGEPIVSGDMGVRYTTDPAQLRAAATALRSRARTQLVTARALRQTAARLEGPQQRLWAA